MLPSWLKWVIGGAVALILGTAAFFFGRKLARKKLDGNPALAQDVAELQAAFERIKKHIKATPIPEEKKPVNS